MIDRIYKAFNKECFKQNDVQNDDIETKRNFNLCKAGTFWNFLAIKKNPPFFY